MRFRGGGVGHRYMRQIEPWLDGTGWGAAWPSFNHRIPDLGPTGQAGIDGQVNGNSTRAMGEESDGEGGGAESPEQPEEDGEGDDPEQPEDDDQDEDEDEDETGKADRHADPDSDGDEEMDPFPSGFISL